MAADAAEGSGGFSQGGADSTISCVATHPPFWTSEYGARGVLFHDGSPGRLLSALVSQLAESHPWMSSGKELEWHPIPVPLLSSSSSSSDTPPVARSWAAAISAGLVSARRSAQKAVLDMLREGELEAHPVASVAPTVRTAGLRRVVLRLSAACAEPAIGTANPQFRRTRHVFSATRCIQVQVEAPAGASSLARWEESCDVVWSGPLL